MISDKKFFYKKLSDETLTELDNFLEAHPNDEVDYWSYREAKQLYVKILNELADSIKDYGKAFDKILKDNDYEDLISIESNNPALELKRLNAITKINTELEDLQQRVIEPSKELLNKISMLHRKFYINK